MPSINWAGEAEVDSSSVSENSEISEEPDNNIGYDGIFVSSMVSEKKRFLWEIKDFEDVLGKCVTKAMHFEFEMGRLGSIEKHLPRKSRWRVTLDTAERQDPELTLQLLFPQDKVIFYKFFAQIMDGPQKETNVTTRRDDLKFQEASCTRTAVENRFLLRPNFGECIRDWSIQNYISGQSLFSKIEMEIIEDSSTS